MKKCLIKLVYLVLLIVSCQLLQAQKAVAPQANPIIKIVMLDGNIFQGERLAVTSESIIIQSITLGKLSIPFDQIKSLELLDDSVLKKGEIWNRNIAGLSNFISPSGYSLRQGEGQYHNFMVIWNEVSYGFTDFFSLGLGFEGLSIAGGSPPVVTLNAKFAFPVIKNGYHISMGSYFLGVPDSESGSSLVAAPYLVNTFGSRDQHISIGVGYGYFDNQFADNPIITISGQYRFSGGFALITDNYIIPYISDDDESSPFVITIGGRLIRKRITWDFGLGFYGDEGRPNVIPLPIIGIRVPFGNY